MVGTVNENATVPMTLQSICALVAAAGARVASRSGRSEHYGAPRDFSFEVKAAFTNGMALQITARQFNYRDPWETKGRVNELVDVALLREGAYTALPKGHAWFQGQDQEEGIDEPQLREIVAVVSRLNPKIYTLQQLTGDL